MAINLYSPQEIAFQIAERVRAERLRRGWTQPELAERAGMSHSTYRLFEQTGRISLDRLLSVAAAFGQLGQWETVFAPAPVYSVDQVVAARHSRSRGRRQGASARASAPRREEAW